MATSVTAIEEIIYSLWSDKNIIAGDVVTTICQHLFDGADARIAYLIIEKVKSEHADLLRQIERRLADDIGSDSTIATVEKHVVTTVVGLIKKERYSMAKLRERLLHQVLLTMKTNQEDVQHTSGTCAAIHVYIAVCRELDDTKEAHELLFRILAYGNQPWVLSALLSIGDAWRKVLDSCDMDLVNVYSPMLFFCYNRYPHELSNVEKVCSWQISYNEEGKRRRPTSIVNLLRNELDNLRALPEDKLVMPSSAATPRQTTLKFTNTAIKQVQRISIMAAFIEWYKLHSLLILKRVSVWLDDKKIGNGLLAITCYLFGLGWMLAPTSMTKVTENKSSAMSALLENMQSKPLPVAKCIAKILLFLNKEDKKVRMRVPDVVCKWLQINGITKEDLKGGSDVEFTSSGSGYMDISRVMSADDSLIISYLAEVEYNFPQINLAVRMAAKPSV